MKLKLKKLTTDFPGIAFILGLRGLEINLGLSVVSVKDKFRNQGQCAKGVGWTQFWVGQNKILTKLGWVNRPIYIYIYISLKNRFTYFSFQTKLSNLSRYQIVHGCDFVVVCDVVYGQKYTPKKYKVHVAIYVKNPLTTMISVCPQIDHDSCTTLDIYTQQAPENEQLILFQHLMAHRNTSTSH